MMKSASDDVSVDEDVGVGLHVRSLLNIYSIFSII